MANRIDTIKLNQDLLAMHDTPLRPDAADKNTLRDAMTIVSAYTHIVEQLSTALGFIGEVPHHIFKNPQDVVSFYERNYRFVPKRTEAA